MRGRSIGNWYENDHSQRLELGNDIANSVTSVSKDSLVCEIDSNMIDAYGLSRTRDKHGDVVKRRLNPWVNCLHTQMGGGRENMYVLVVEIYG